MATAIIAEKPSAALKIASALADGTVKKQTYNKKVPYYEIKHGKEKIFVICAVGHLYNLAEKEKKGWTYPVYEIEWKPVYEINKSSKYTKDYVYAIKKIAKEVNNFVIATDYDDEGSVIGYNVLRFICEKEDAKRMKFSTTIKKDLIEAYKKPMKHLDFPNIMAGITRHKLDYFWGINLSRALTLSIKNSTGMFKIMSIGRVQGPALYILYDREKEIKAFKPKPYWQIELITKELNAMHKEGKFWDKKIAEKILKKIKGEKVFIDNIEERKYDQAPPHPFDLTALQVEVYKLFNVLPKQTLAIAQDLYVNSYISYPRTSSNQLPESVGYEDLLKELAKQDDYKELCESILKFENIKPNNGNKKDPAHPAIYPTGEIPKELKGKEKKVYDLIVRRTLASFGKPATRETVTLTLDVKDEKFSTKGTRTIVPGWHVYYGPLMKIEEKEMPKFKKGDELKVKDLKLHEDETKPPKRYTPVSIIKELEKRHLGTKATRSHIIDNLYNRNYIIDKSMEVTNLGMKTIETLKKYCEDILNEDMTREFEDEMEQIREGKVKKEKILDSAKKMLDKILVTFKNHEKEIGKSLSKANVETLRQESIVGKCDKCDADLRILYSRRFKSYFVACSGYPKCKNTFSLTRGLPKPTDKKCPECNYPLLKIIRKGTRPFDYCINKNCPKKLEWKREHKKEIEEFKKKIAENNNSVKKVAKKKVTKKKSVKKK